MTKLDLGGNDLYGAVPDFSKCPSLRWLSVANNPQLGGIISKALVNQCSELIKYSGCKQQPDIEGPHMQGRCYKIPTYMVSCLKIYIYITGPFIIGASLASEDISAAITDFGHLINCARPHTNRLTDVPSVDKNTGWVKWQAAWLEGLRGMAPEDIVYVFCGSEAFRDKFDDRNRWLDVHSGEQTLACTKCSFDPTYELPANERAASILDWERRHIFETAATNGLKIVYVSSSGNEIGERPSWYSALKDGSGPLST